MCYSFRETTQSRSKYYLPFSHVAHSNEFSFRQNQNTEIYPDINVFPLMDSIPGGSVAFLSGDHNKNNTGSCCWNCC